MPRTTSPPDRLLHGLRAIHRLAPETLVTVEEAVTLLGISKATFYRRYYPALKAHRFHGTPMWRAQHLQSQLDRP